MFTVKLPQYTVGDGVLKDLGVICKKYGKRILIIGGNTALEKISMDIGDYLKQENIKIVDFIWYGGECSYKNIDQIKTKAENLNIDVIVGVGGGKALDTAKAAGERANIPVVTIPTIAATCAATTPLSVVYKDNGSFDSIYLLENLPAHILIDTDIIVNSPTKYLWAGIGDTLAKYYELEATTREKKLSHSVLMGKNLSIMCVEPLIEYGAKAIEDSDKGTNSFEFEEIILNIIVTTGIVSMLIGEEFNGACAHGLFNALTSLEHIEKNHLHGEVVSYGILVMLMLDGREKEIERLYPFYKSISLPTSLEDLEIINTIESLDPILEDAVHMEDVKKMPYKVTKSMFLGAIDKLEALNKRLNYKK